MIEVLLIGGSGTECAALHQHLINAGQHIEIVSLSNIEEAIDKTCQLIEQEPIMIKAIERLDFSFPHINKNTRKGHERPYKFHR